MLCTLRGWDGRSCKCAGRQLNSKPKHIFNEKIYWDLQLSKKKEFIDAKMRTQAMVILPTELQDYALRAWDACKTVRKCFCFLNNRIIFLFLLYCLLCIYYVVIEKDYKDPCDRAFYTFKCSYSVEPVKFTFAWARNKCFIHISLTDTMFTK